MQLNLFSTAETRNKKDGLLEQHQDQDLLLAKYRFPPSSGTVESTIPRLYYGTEHIFGLSKQNLNIRSRSSLPLIQSYFSQHLRQSLPIIKSK
jgi:hypothetical protein